jgi:hypothetical protein
LSDPPTPTLPSKGEGDEGRALTDRHVCPVKGQTTSGCESRPGKPPEEPGSQPPASGEILASKRGEAKLQAVTNVNSAASKQLPVRDRGGRAWMPWAKAAVRAWDSGAARTPSGVREAACSEGRLVNWGGPPAPGQRVDRGGSTPWYKPRGESQGCAEGVGAGHSTSDRRDSTTRREGRARTSVTRRLRRDG